MKKSVFLLFSLLFVNCSFALTAQSDDNFLVISDIHLDTTATHKMDIMPASPDKDNDLDNPTFIALMNTLSKNIQNGVVPAPKFILLLGDIVGHIRTTDTFVYKSEAEVFSRLKEYFPETPIFYTFGNNDSFDANYGPFTGKNNSPAKVATENGWLNGFLSTGTMCTTTNAALPCVIPDEDPKHEPSTNGYYSAYLQPKLRLISVNSVLFSTKRVGVTEDQDKHELVWLATQLQTAQDQHESVLITMHIPPGYNIRDHSAFWQQDNLDNFLKLMNQYKSSIIGILSSHTHMEELKVIKDSHNANVNGVFLAPGLSTSHGNMPGVKTFYFNQTDQQWALSNYQAFNFRFKNEMLDLNSLYDYNSTYCMSTTNGNMLDCLNNITIDKFKKYYSLGNEKYAGEINSPADLIINIH